MRAGRGVDGSVDVHLYLAASADNSMIYGVVASVEAPLLGGGDKAAVVAEFGIWGLFTGPY